MNDDNGNHALNKEKEDLQTRLALSQHMQCCAQEGNHEGALWVGKEGM